MSSAAFAQLHITGQPPELAPLTLSLLPPCMEECMLGHAWCMTGKCVIQACPYYGNSLYRKQSCRCCYPTQIAELFDL